MRDCELLHERVHGHSRTNELRDALVAGTPIAALKNGQVCAYLSAPTNWLANHGVAETDEDMCALLAGQRRWQDNRFHSCCLFTVPRCCVGA
jgi:hypothetical protein